MKYIYVVLMFYSYSMVPLYADKSKVDDTPQNVQEKKLSVKYHIKEANTVKMTHFIFKVSHDRDNMAIRKNQHLLSTEKSKKYEYENRSGFKFRFTPGRGASHSNIVSRHQRGSAVNTYPRGASTRKPGGRH